MALDTHETGEVDGVRDTGFYARAFAAFTSD